ncbi:MAG: hypothetical protein LBQ20_06035 [Rhodanobacter sp.]|jgi:uncharacterized protein (DUF1778 family)|nr:hypothetical protein [Rhodanobacter sp.]
MSATERVVLLMSKPQKDALNKRAMAMNVSVSEYIRQAALGESSELLALQEMMRTAEHSIKRAHAALDTTFANMAARAARRSTERPDHRPTKARRRG